jgi:hypothetical protein
MTLKLQNYKHYKLPITINPLDYGKLIFKTENIYIIQINKTNIAIITQFDEFNEVKLFKEGDLMFEYKDHKIDDNSFIRSLDNKKYTFTNNKLTNININKALIRANNLINKLGIRKYSSMKHPKNIIKLRKVRSNYK